MEPPFGIIAARSEGQAMDWSLVLISQGIEATIQFDAATGGWHLIVNWPDYRRAVEALRQYRVENRSEVWRHELPGTGLIFDWRGVVWFFLLTLVFILDQSSFGHLRDAGMMDSTAIRGGEWWRLFTATMLHQDWLHLLHNMASGALFLCLAMGGTSPGLALLAAVLSGVGGNLAGLVLYAEPHRSLGASGMVMGTLGLLTTQSLSLLGAGLPGRQLVARGLLGGFLLLVWFGLNPDPKVDVLAHVAGFLCGGVLGALLVFLPAKIVRNSRLNSLAELLCGGIVLVTWWLALR